METRSGTKFVGNGKEYDIILELSIVRSKMQELLDEIDRLAEAHKESELPD